MKTIHEINEAGQEKMSVLCKECRLFFAFNNEQFEKGREENPLKEGEKYVRIFGGGILPNSEVKKFSEGIENIEKWKKEERKKMKDGKIEHIKYELANYECYYTGCIDDAVAVLPYPRKDILKVYIEERKKWAECN